VLGEDRPRAGRLLLVQTDDLVERQGRALVELGVRILPGPRAVVLAAEQSLVDPGALDPAKVVEHVRWGHPRRRRQGIGPGQLLAQAAHLRDGRLLRVAEHDQEQRTFVPALARPRQVVSGHPATLPQRSVRMAG
jgi:hypothetical protein